MQKINIVLIVLGVVLASIAVSRMGTIPPKQKSISSTRYFSIQSIDTMKYSRDLAREKLGDPSFDSVIDQQVKNIAATGATHVAIGTPYDDEFLPYMERWVKAARKYHLNVWFRGNFSGWEKWFEYDPITREQHKEMLPNFFETHAQLFKDGDIFTSCPECENGGPGDPRMTGDEKGHRQFLIDEYNISKEEFQKRNLDVMANFYSMNGDIAKLVMDKQTTAALDGIVTVDHYVKDVDTLISDIHEYEKLSGGRIMIGEWGAPIPDLHGDMTEEDQSRWIGDALERLVTETDIVGMNYWTNVGGSTALWSSTGTPKRAAQTITDYFNPQLIHGTVINQYGKTIDAVYVMYQGNTLVTENGTFTLPYRKGESFEISKTGYTTSRYHLDEPTNKEVIFTLPKEDLSTWERLRVSLYNLFN